MAIYRSDDRSASVGDSNLDQDEPKPASSSAALKRYHASRTPAQRAAWRKRVSLGTSSGMDAWHARRTDAERQQARQRIKDAAICRTWSPQAPAKQWQRGHKPVGNTTPDALARRSLTRVQTASVKKIMRDIVGVRPDLIRDAIIEGLQAAPPRSFPYIALAAAYLDGKPIPAGPPIDGREDLSSLTRDQLLTRALCVAQRLQAEEQSVASGGEALPVIEVMPEPAE